MYYHAIQIIEAFRDDFNIDTVDASVWQVATWSEHGGQTGTERCFAKNGYLNMKFINNNGTFLSSAIQTRKEFLYGRWEARIKPSSVPGVLNSLYTIDWDDISTTNTGDDGTKQEIDIEFLTFAFGSGKGKVHFAVHASGLQSFDTNPDIDLNFDPSADFHVWGFEIAPDHLEWFVDNTTLLTYKYSKHPVAINSPYQLKLNFWSQANWINGPPASGVECLYLIDWIRFIPYE
jgi:beta-glucanase (GH16 family)